jgi:hypothetical protein
MQQVVETSTRNVLSYGLIVLTSLFLLSGCLRSQDVQTVPVVETRTVQVPRPAPIVPNVDQLRLRTVDWKIITPENVDEVFASLSGDAVLFAVTSSGYEALALNLSDVRALVQQQQKIIAIYKQSFR